MQPPSSQHKAAIIRFLLLCEKWRQDLFSEVFIYPSKVTQLVIKCSAERFYVFIYSSSLIFCDLAAFHDQNLLDGGGFGGGQ